MPIAEAQVKTRVKATIDLPAEDFDYYERQAQLEKKPLEQVFSERLKDCVLHNAVKGIWFNDRDRQDLEKALGANVSNAGEVTRLVGRATSLRVGPATIQIPSATLERLRSRCNDVDFAKWLAHQISHTLDLVVEGQI